MASQESQRKKGITYEWFGTNRNHSLSGNVGDAWPGDWLSGASRESKSLGVGIDWGLSLFVAFRFDSPDVLPTSLSGMPTQSLQEGMEAAPLSHLW